MPTLESQHLQTSRLDLVPIVREHAARMFEVLKDPALYGFTEGAPPTDANELGCRFERWEKRLSPDGTELWFNWAVRESPSGKFVGHLQASVTSGYADIAWVIGTLWQNRGYATEAAKAVMEWILKLGVNEIRAAINPDHVASIKVAERIGLRRTEIFSGREIVWASSPRRA